MFRLSDAIFRATLRFAWFFDAADKKSLETFWHTQVINLKYLRFDKISVSSWCSMVAHNWRTIYLYVYLFI